MITDALLVAGVEALDIMSTTSTRPAGMTAFAKVHGARISYPESGEE